MRLTFLNIHLYMCVYIYILILCLIFQTLTQTFRTEKLIAIKRITPFSRRFKFIHFHRQRTKCERVAADVITIRACLIRRWKSQNRSNITTVNGLETTCRCFVQSRFNVVALEPLTRPFDTRMLVRQFLQWARYNSIKINWEQISAEFR